MVKKFLTREQTYSQLLVKVSEFERHIEKLKKDNDELRERLHDLKIDTSQPSEDKSQQNFQDEEIIDMRKNIIDKGKEYTLLQEKYKKINIVNDQICGWAKRVYGKFGALTNEPELAVQPDDICKVFSIMEKIVCNELSSLKDKQDEPLEADDTFIDFATEDFINKNIRVRPISGITHDDPTRDGRASNISRGDNANNEDAHDNQEQLAKMELDEQRTNVKKKIEQYKEEQRKKLLLEEKKNAKK